MPETRIIELVQSVVFLIPVGMLIWKLAGVYHTTEKHSKDIDGLGKKVGEIIEADNKTIAKMSTKLDELENTLIAMTESMKYTQRDIGEIKTELKEMRADSH
jgi:ribosomal protein L11